MATTVTSQRATAGSPELRRIQVAMVCAGLAAFALMYATQALLPDIGRTFGVGATTASLTVSVTTGVLALTVVPMSALAERLGRTRVMTAGLSLACVSVLAGSVAPALWLLLVARGVDGLALGGVVAVAMGHIGAEVDARASTAAIGVYVSGTSVGGLMGRLVPAAVSTVAGWRASMAVLAVVGAMCVLVFARVVPPSSSMISGKVAAGRKKSRDHRQESGSETGGQGGGGTGWQSALAPVRRHLRDRGIVALCAAALLLMGGFVATYNYLTYRLGEGPFGLSTSTIGLVFLAYLSGTVSSTVATRLAARAGRKPVLLASIAVAVVGLLGTLSSSLPAVLAGLVIFTFGFFGAHSIASGWVTGRAERDKSHASALYLLAYYLGSSIGGTAIGLAWTSGGWPATVTAVGACYLVAALVVLVGVRRPDARAARSTVAGSPAARTP